MGRAWPRYLPRSTAEATAHALLIEAHAILVEQLAEGQRELLDAHGRAAAYARAHYTPDEVRGAWNACATAPGNENILLHHLVTLSAVGMEIDTPADQEFRADIAA